MIAGDSRKFTHSIELLRHDLAYVTRRLSRRVALASAIVGTLGLAIGTSAAVYSLLDRLFLRVPPGIGAPEDLRRLFNRYTRATGPGIRDLFEYREFRQLDTALADGARVAAYTPPESISIATNNARQIARASFTTSNYFSVLETHASMGRFFVPDEDRMGAGAKVAVLSDPLRQRLFGEGQDVIGHSLDVDGQRYRIVGVARAEFSGLDLDAPDLWLPLGNYAKPPIGGQPWYSRWRSGQSLRLVARLRPKVTDDWLSSRGTTVRRRGGDDEPRVDTTAVVVAGPIIEALAPSIEPKHELSIAIRLGGVVAVVLLIACANVATLLLAHATEQRREMAIRMALGISRRRLIAQLLTESLLLSLLAGAFGGIVALWAAAALRALLLPQTHWAGSAFDSRVAVFTAVVTVGTGIVIGLLPALRASRFSFTGSILGVGRDNAVQRSRLLATLIIIQTALLVVLLAGTGLFVRSLTRVRSIDLGYDAERLVFATVEFTDPSCHCRTRFADGHESELTDGLRATAERLSSLPTVERTALAAAGPMYGFELTRSYVPGRDSMPKLDGHEPALIGVTPDYFAVTGLRLVEGRLISRADGATAPPVLVVNQTMARTVWPGEQALGRCVKFLTVENPCFTVVGIVADSHLRTVVEGPTMQYYYSLDQWMPKARAPSLLVIRAAHARADVVAETARRELHQSFPGATPRVTTMVARIGPQLRPWKLGAQLFSAFSLFALAIASFGIFSVVYFAVRGRARDIGVRIALGARARHVLQVVLVEGLGPVCVGLTIGVLMTLALGKSVESVLYDTSPREPIVLAGVVLAMLGSAALASLAPALWATRIDPVVVLREG